MITLVVNWGVVAGSAAIGIIVTVAIVMVYQYGKSAGRKEKR